MKSVKVGFTMGLGIGLMLGAVIMFLISISDLNEANSSSNESMNNKVVYNKDDNNISVDTKPKAEETEIDNESKVDVTEDNKIKKDATKNTNEEEYKIINIPRGSGSNIVTSELYNKGLITNKKEFNDYMENKKVTTKLGYGTFKIKKNSSYDEIIKILTQ